MSEELPAGKFPSEWDKELTPEERAAFIEKGKSDMTYITSGQAEQDLAALDVAFGNISENERD
jgi:hypothetical protein